MYPAVSTVGVSFLRVAANAAAVRQQGLGICRNLLHRHTGNPDVSSLAVKMLRELRSIYTAYNGKCRKDALPMKF